MRILCENSLARLASVERHSEGNALVWCSDELQCSEVSIQRLLEEELDRQMARRARSRVLLDILDLQEILSKFFGGDQVR
jgi:hypothetical protein